MPDDSRDPTTHPQAAAYQARLEEVERDLRALLRGHASTAGWAICVHAICEVAGDLGELLIELDPAERARLLQRLDPLRDQVALRLAVFGQPPQ